MRTVVTSKWVCYGAKIALSFWWFCLGHFRSCSKILFILQKRLAYIDFVFVIEIVYDGRKRQNNIVYKWRCRNGCYVSIKTNWSWFVDPWKKQIDFIIGKHLILNEPLNKNIFESNQDAAKDEHLDDGELQAIKAKIIAHISKVSRNLTTNPH